MQMQRLQQLQQTETNFFEVLKILVQQVQQFLTNFFKAKSKKLFQWFVFCPETVAVGKAEYKRVYREVQRMQQILFYNHIFGWCNTCIYARGIMRA